MAPVQVSHLGAALEQLQQEAQEAASRVTLSVQDEYHRNGVVVVRNVVSRSWLDTLRRGCEVAQDDAGPFAEYLQQPTDGGIFFTDLELARRLPMFSAFCQYGPCGAVAGAVMGSTSIRYLYDQLFVKEQGVSTPTPWHQDGGYWRVSGSKIGSVFVPLDPVNANDGLAFVKGSHTWELHNPQHFADGTPYTGTSLPPMPDISAMVKAGQVDLVTFDLQPGDVVVFSARTTHGGPGNWGRALSTRWTGDDATFWARPGEGAVPTGNVHLRNGELLAHNAAAFPQVWSDNDVDERHGSARRLV
jgi:ectoine hydroxylase-related dioxygenase (phytanoyl-CoA dioxygenase family)